MIDVIRVPVVGDLQSLVSLVIGENPDPDIVNEFYAQVEKFVRGLFVRSNHKTNLSYLINEYANRNIEDIIAQCISTIFIGIKSYDMSKSRFSTWAYVVCENSTIDYVFKMKSENRLCICETDFFARLRHKEDSDDATLGDIIDENNSKKTSYELNARREGVISDFYDSIETASKSKDLFKTDKEKRICEELFGSDIWDGKIEIIDEFCYEHIGDIVGLSGQGVKNYMQGTLKNRLIRAGFTSCATKEEEDKIWKS